MDLCRAYCFLASHTSSENTCLLYASDLTFLYHQCNSGRLPFEKAKHPEPFPSSSEQQPPLCFPPECSPQRISPRRFRTASGSRAVTVGTCASACGWPCRGRRCPEPMGLSCVHGPVPCSCSCPMPVVLSCAHGPVPCLWSCPVPVVLSGACGPVQCPWSCPVPVVLSHARGPVPCPWSCPVPPVPWAGAVPAAAGHAGCAAQRRPAHKPGYSAALAPVGEQRGTHSTALIRVMYSTKCR